VPLLIEANDYNSIYLATKAKKLGHMLLQTYLITVALHWQDELESVTKRYERLEKLRHLAKTHDLLLQEETRPVGIALFGTPSLTVHLGFDQPNLASPDWYQQAGHPYVRAIAQILDALIAWPHLEYLEFMVSTGIDPLTGLQIQLDRQNFPTSTLPSSVCDHLETQKIYSFQSGEG
jgi:3,4-dihydroxy 2-butanone 4-phosphate synthase/GTP cyclohydrolase II